jgi:hypothetical protein
MEIDCRGYAEKCTAVGRPGPVEFRDKAAAEPVRNCHRMETRLPFGRRPEKPAALRRAQPFVTIADIPIGSDRTQIDRYLTRGMGLVDQHTDAGRTAQRADLCDRQYRGARRGDVVDDREPCARGQSRAYSGDNGSRLRAETALPPRSPAPRRVWRRSAPPDSRATAPESVPRRRAPTNAARRCSRRWRFRQR